MKSKVDLRTNTSLLTTFHVQPMVSLSPKPLCDHLPPATPAFNAFQDSRKSSKQEDVRVATDAAATAEVGGQVLLLPRQHFEDHLRGDDEALQCPLSALPQDIHPHVRRRQAEAGSGNAGCGWRKRPAAGSGGWQLLEAAGGSVARSSCTVQTKTRKSNIIVLLNTSS
jgi:hypothetical protein